MEGRATAWGYPRESGAPRACSLQEARAQAVLGTRRERPTWEKTRSGGPGAAFGFRRKQHGPLGASHLNADLRCSGIAFRGELTQAISQRSPGHTAAAALNPPELGARGGAGEDQRGSRAPRPRETRDQGKTPQFPRAEPQRCPATAQARPRPPPLSRRRSTLAAQARPLPPALAGGNRVTAQAPLSGFPRGSPPRCDPLTPLSRRGHGGCQGPVGTPAGGGGLYVRAGPRSAAAAAHWASARPARGLPPLRAAAGAQGRAGECAPAGTWGGPPRSGSPRPVPELKHPLPAPPSTWATPTAWTPVTRAPPQVLSGCGVYDGTELHEASA